ncbi:hypothetical protein [Deinococcus yunweiensis]|uniref:hypothetical protein n=1 Tax=Deinococcus yunweiensis TaxID=367282 RepID=UPI00398E40C2
MSGTHPATAKAALREHLRRHPVVTEVQLARRGWTQAAAWLDLPYVTLDVRTQVTQPTSQTPVTFVSAEERSLEVPPRELLHAACLAETATRLEGLRPEWRDGEYAYVTCGGRMQGVRPDAEVIVDVASRTSDIAVEVDTGYGHGVRTRKYTAFAGQGYGEVVWATTIHGRVQAVAAEVREWHGLGHMPGIRRVTVCYVDVHRRGDPYAPRRRLHKVSHVDVPLRAG